MKKYREKFTKDHSVINLEIKYMLILSFTFNFIEIHLKITYLENFEVSRFSICQPTTRNTTNRALCFPLLKVFPGIYIINNTPIYNLIKCSNSKKIQLF